MAHFRNRLIIETKKGPHHYINLDRVERIVLDHDYKGQITAAIFYFGKDDTLRISPADVMEKEQYWENIIRQLIEIDVVPQS